MGYKVGLTETARDDLGAAVRFIAIEGQNPEAASRLGNELLDAALSLAPAARLAGAPSPGNAEALASLLAHFLSGERG